MTTILPHGRAFPRLVLAICVGGCQPACTAPAYLPIDAVEPPVALRGGPAELSLSGKQLPAADGSTATVTLQRIRDLDGHAVPPGDDLGPQPAVALHGQFRVDFNIPDTSPTGVYRARLTLSNGSEAVLDDALAVLPAPRIDGLASAGVCLSQPSPVVTVLGADLLVRDGKGPPMHLASASLFFSQDLDSAATDADCRKVPFARASLELCTAVAAALPISAGPGAYALVIYGPVPAHFSIVFDTGSSRTLLALFNAADAPLDLSIGSPPFSSSIALVNTPSTQPEVTLDGQPWLATLADCAELDMSGFQSCGTLSLQVPQGYPPGAHEVAYTAPTSCRTNVAFHLAERPVIASVTPPLLCQYAFTNHLDITGSGFQLPSVLFGGQSQLIVGGCPALTTYDFPACSNMDVALPTPLTPGVYELKVVNGSVPAISSAMSSITVAPGPASFDQPSPAHFYNGIAHQVTIPGRGFTAAPLASDIAPVQGGGLLPVDAVQSANAMTITVAAGTPAGDWQFILQDNTPCAAAPSRPFTIHGDPLAVNETFDSPNGWSIALVGVGMDNPVFDPSAGHPGGAATYQVSGAGPDWYFYGNYGYDLPDADLAGLRFDLRASGSGAPVSGADVTLLGIGCRLEYDLPSPPTSAWTTWYVPFDDPTGWRRDDGLGTTVPASAADLAAAVKMASISIRGRWTSDAGGAALDNVQLEFHH